MTGTDVSSPRTYPGIVLAAVTVGVTGAIAALPAPALGLLLAVAGVWLSLRSRAELRAHPELSGWGLSLAAMIVSSVTLAATLVPFLAPLLLSLAFLVTGGAAG